MQFLQNTISLIIVTFELVDSNELEDDELEDDELEDDDLEEKLAC